MSLHIFDRTRPQMWKWAAQDDGNTFSIAVGSYRFSWYFASVVVIAAIVTATFWFPPHARDYARVGFVVATITAMAFFVYLGYAIERYGIVLVYERSSGLVRLPHLRKEFHADRIRKLQVLTGKCLWGSRKPTLHVLQQTDSCRVELNIIVNENGADTRYSVLASHLFRHISDVARNLSEVLGVVIDQLEAEDSNIRSGEVSKG